MSATGHQRRRRALAAKAEAERKTKLQRAAEERQAQIDDEMKAQEEAEKEAAHQEYLSLPDDKFILEGQATNIMVKDIPNDKLREFAADTYGEKINPRMTRANHVARFIEIQNKALEGRSHDATEPSE